jgi:hypothetical protein
MSRASARAQSSSSNGPASASAAATGSTGACAARGSDSRSCEITARAISARTCGDRLTPFPAAWGRLTTTTRRGSPTSWSCRGTAGTTTSSRASTPARSSPGRPSPAGASPTGSPHAGGRIRRPARLGRSRARGGTRLRFARLPSAFRVPDEPRLPRRGAAHALRQAPGHGHHDLRRALPCLQHPRQMIPPASGYV